MPERRWSPSMMQAWPWAVSSLEQGLTVAQGLAEYRAGGGHIATTDWNYLRARAREAAVSSEQADQFPFTEILPESIYTHVDIDYGQKYVAIADVSYRDPVTGETVTRSVTVESDYSLSMDDWTDAIVETSLTYGVEGGFAGVSVDRVWFYTPEWTHIPL